VRLLGAWQAAVSDAAEGRALDDGRSGFYRGFGNAFLVFGLADPRQEWPGHITSGIPPIVAPFPVLGRGSRGRLAYTGAISRPRLREAELVSLKVEDVAQERIQPPRPPPPAWRVCEHGPAY
jgi:hypothetical protein